MRAASRLRAALYDAAIVPMTAHWYAAVLDRVPPGCRLLDIGIGTGAALARSAPSILGKNLRITGIDVDPAYVDRCREVVTASGLAHVVEPRLESVYEHAGGPYDAAYFSGSFMLLPDPVAALRHVATLLSANGRLYFTQTFEHERSAVLEKLKPALRLLTSIDFGSVTYEQDFRDVLGNAGVAIEERVVLHAGRSRSSVMVVARAVAAA